MNIPVSRIDASRWAKEFSELSHLASFGESRPGTAERADFALVGQKGNELVGYVQCLEMDSDTLYWQLGGAMPTFVGSVHVISCYRAFIEWSLERYQRITTRIQNINIRMLHMAMKMGFLIVGTWNFKNKIYMELVNERGS